MVLLVYALRMALRHPLTSIVYWHCDYCNVSFVPDAQKCPSCGTTVHNSPQRRKMSAIPWWGSVLVMLLGIGCWIVGACGHIVGLDEAGRAMVYMPMGALFGMALPR